MLVVLNISMATRQELKARDSVDALPSMPVPSARVRRDGALAEVSLVQSLAERIGSIGRIPVLDAITVSGAASEADLAAKARAGFQAGRISLRRGVDLTDEVGLLVDDRWRTGWTATIAGALLREAGAAQVMDSDGQSLAEMDEIIGTEIIPVLRH